MSSAGSSAAPGASSGSLSSMPLLAGNASENDRIEALVSQGPGWTPGQQVPQQARFLQNTSKVPPPHYVCHRCGQGGHWISACPTNGDTAFDFRRIKKVSQFSICFLLVACCRRLRFVSSEMANKFLTASKNNTCIQATGIPKSFLETVSESEAGDGAVMMTGEPLGWKVVIFFGQTLKHFSSLRGWRLCQGGHAEQQFWRCGPCDGGV